MASPEALTQHWRWRPDWTPERRNWWWYGTFETDATVQRLAAAARKVIRPGAPVDRVPPRWLHLSLAEVGYAADLGRVLPYECARAARALLADACAVDLEVGPLTTMPGAVVLEVRSPGLTAVHDRILTALASTLTRPPVQRPFVPHVSVAYVHRDSVVDDVLDRAQVGPDGSNGQGVASTRLMEIALVEVVRHRPHYRWTTRCRLRLGRRRSGRS